MIDQATVDRREDRAIDTYLLLKKWEREHDHDVLPSLLRGERGDAPSRTAAQERLRSSLFRSDAVVGLAILACLAIFGLFSIGQFLQDILGR